jgi:glycosyltransferase involved in cell wall biosynthesis
MESVAGWSQDIFLVDSDSTDQTVEIAREFTDKIYNHTYVDHASQLLWAFENLPFQNEWVLFLDADNVVSDELKREIDTRLENDDPSINGYYCIHREIFRDKPVRGVKKWWARLVRHTHSRVDNSELVDYGIEIEGTVGYIAAPIIEDNVKERDIDFWIDKHQRFARRMAAEEVLRRGGYVRWTVEPKFFGTSDQRRVWLKNHWMNMPLFVRPFIYWFYRYFLTGCFLQGRHGLTYTVFQSLWFRLVCDIWVQELLRRIEANETSYETLMETFGTKKTDGDIVGRRDAATGKI